MLEKIKSNILKNKIIIVIIVGCILRLAFVGRIPANNNYFRDEAFSAYEAYSMLNYGMDSHGYHNPVYLETWGSGMSAVQCYFQMIFIKILGFNSVTVRLPQAILGCVTLLFFYLLLKELSNEQVAFWSTLVLAVSPWHINMSRWGLDCNYYVGFVTIALYLIITSRNVWWKTIIAAVITAIAIYSYASPWVIMPVLVYGTIIYLFVKKEISLKSIILFTIVLGVLVSPLLLFVLVNLDILGEIKTEFISIPRLSYFRSGDVKPSFKNLGTLITYFWTQYDFVSFDATRIFGTYYIFSNLFLVIGIIVSVIKRNSKTIVMWIWFACGLFMGLSIETNFQRLNILFLPLIFFIGTGIVFVIDWVKKYKKATVGVITALYGISAILFAGYYFTDYNEMMDRVWPAGAEAAIQFAMQYDGTIHVSGMRHPIVLCYSKYPVDKYVETVEYEDDHAKFLQPIRWDGYDFTDYTVNNAVSGDVYICSVDSTEDVEWMQTQDMSFAQFGMYYVAVAN